MTVEELKKTIEDRAGVPANLLKGETHEETIAQAKALVAYKREHDQKIQKTTAEQFADYMAGFVESSNRRTADILGINYTPQPEDPAAAALADIEKSIKGPAIPDGGEIDTSRLPDPRPTSEQFEDWFNAVTAFDPSVDEDGWKTVCDMD